MLLKLVQGTRARVQRGGGVTGFFGFRPQSCLGSAVGIQLVRELHQLESNLRPVYGGGIQLATIYVVGIQLSLPHVHLESKFFAKCISWNPSCGHFAALESNSLLTRHLESKFVAMWCWNPTGVQ